MAAIKIENFGGELPSVSPRALPANSAQTNRNLYLATTEFRPLSEDSVVAACDAGTKTIHRFARREDGEFNTNPAEGWIATPQERSYVKGQVNDERTERTYYTVDDGSERPRVIDVKGNNRLLGVPRPTKSTVTVVEGKEFTPEEAENFLYGEVKDSLITAFSGNRVPAGQSRWTSNGTPIAGPYSTYGMYFTKDNADQFVNNWVPEAWRSQTWNLLANVVATKQTEWGILGTEMGAIYYSPDQIQSGFFIHIPALPYAPAFNETAASTAIREIVFPQDAPKAGEQVFSDSLITELVDKAKTYLDPENYAKSERDELDGYVREMSELLAKGPSSLEGDKPVEADFEYDDNGVTRKLPEKPTGPEYELIYVGESDQTQQRTQAWINYDKAVADYKAALEEYNTSASKSGDAKSRFIAKIKELQDKALAVTKLIESKGDARWKKLAEDGTIVEDWFSSKGGVSELVGETETRIIDTRFYFVTFVTDWGEESEPSPVTDMVEVDQNDTCTVTRPSSSSGEAFSARHITHWRLYRSNTGSVNSAFQYVPYYTSNSYNETDKKWTRDNEVIAGIPITITEYTDTMKGSELGEVCPSVTWAEPPYRMDGQNESFPKPVVGTNPYLRGLTGMPNGIMAGFFDNTVGFCVPYQPYAWPAEYQIVTEFPIVGLGVFGQTLFVGTTGNPYFISGADSASMSALKLDTPQACASRKSIASVEGGVLYASPDGLCVATPSGVQVVTASQYTREDWQKLNPSTMVAVAHENIYYLFYNNGAKGCLTFDLAAKKLGRVDLQADDAFVDMLTDTLYVANGTSITAIFGANTRRTGRWRSSIVTLPLQQPMAWVKVYGDQSTAAPVVVRWYADGVLRHTATFVSLEPQRLPPGRWLEHEIEVESRARVTRLIVAGSTQELQSV